MEKTWCGFYEGYLPSVTEMRNCRVGFTEFTCLWLVHNTCKQEREREREREREVCVWGWGVGGQMGYILGYFRINMILLCVVCLKKNLETFAFLFIHILCLFCFEFFSSTSYKSLLFSFFFVVCIRCFHIFFISTDCLVVFGVGGRVGDGCLLLFCCPFHFLPPIDQWVCILSVLDRNKMLLLLNFCTHKWVPLSSLPHTAMFLHGSAPPAGVARWPLYTQLSGTGFTDHGTVWPYFCPSPCLVTGPMTPALKIDVHVLTRKMPFTAVLWQQNLICVLMYALRIRCIYSCMHWESGVYIDVFTQNQVYMFMYALRIRCTDSYMLSESGVYSHVFTQNQVCVYIHVYTLNLVYMFMYALWIWCICSCMLSESGVYVHVCTQNQVYVYSCMHSESGVYIYVCTLNLVYI